MAKRTYPSDAENISIAADLEDVVQDKRAGWRASGAKARRRQRRYKNMLTNQLVKSAADAGDDGQPDQDDMN